MQNLDVFLTRLMPHVPTCPRPLARQAIVDAAVDFCNETGVITYTTDPTLTEVGVDTYYLDLPKYTTVERIQRAWLDGAPLGIGPLAMHDNVRSYQAVPGDQNGTPRYVTVREPDTVALIPAPDKADTPLVLSVITRPTQDAKQLDDQLFFRWRDGVIAGAIVRICTTPGQSYSDANRAAMAQGNWMTQLNRARIEARRGPLGGSLSVRMNPFA